MAAAGTKSRSLQTAVVSAVFLAALLPAMTMMVVFIVATIGTAGVTSAVAEIVVATVALVIVCGIGAVSVGHVVMRPLRRLRAHVAIAARARARVRKAAADRGEEFIEIASIAKSVEYLRDEIETRVRQRDMLATTVAHDLRTPVWASIQMLETALEGGTDKIDRHALARVLVELKRVARELDHLVSVVRGDADREVVVGSCASLRGVVDEIVATWGHVVSGGIEVSCTDDVAVALACDRARRVVENLVSNAARYASGAVVVEVHRGVVRVSNYALSGSDLAEGQAQQVADDVQTLTESGFGMGLGIARHILEEVGGRLVVEPKSRDTFGVLAYFPVQGVGR